MKVRLNSDKKLVDEVRNKLKETGGHCPCVNPSFYSEDTKCMCKAFLESEIGFCNCGLYEKIEN